MFGFKSSAQRVSNNSNQSKFDYSFNDCRLNIRSAVLVSTTRQPGKMHKKTTTENVSDNIANKKLCTKFMCHSNIMDHGFKYVCFDCLSVCSWMDVWCFVSFWNCMLFWFLSLFLRQQVIVYVSTVPRVVLHIFDRSDRIGFALAFRIFGKLLLAMIECTDSKEENVIKKRFNFNFRTSIIQSN